MPRSRADQKVIAILLLFLFLHAVALITGLLTHGLLLCMPVINLVSGLSVLIGMAVKLYSVAGKQHLKAERRAVMVLLSELLFVILSIIFVLTRDTGYWLTITAYIIFALHMVLLILFLIFMLTFRMKLF